jgi:hypothetical protein
VGPDAEYSSNGARPVIGPGTAKRPDAISRIGASAARHPWRKNWPLMKRIDWPPDTSLPPRASRYAAAARLAVSEALQVLEHAELIRLDKPWSAPNY